MPCCICPEYRVVAPIQWRIPAMMTGNGTFRYAACRAARQQDILFSQLRVGDRIELDGPYGMAYLRENSPRDIVCIAGGSGLSPMVSITRAAAVAPSLAGRRIDFVFGGRTAQDICGKEMLQMLPGFGTNIHYHPVVSGMPEADDGWDGYRGYVHEVAHSLFAARLPSCEIYFAGPPAMGQAIQKMLVDLGVDSTQVHFDQFY